MNFPLAPSYRYYGFTFVCHGSLGPALCRHRGASRTRTPPGPRSKFWPVFQRWEKLSEAQKRKTLVSS